MSRAKARDGRIAPPPELRVGRDRPERELPRGRVPGGRSPLRSVLANDAPVYDDYGVQARYLTEYAQTYVQTSCGPFRGRAASMDLGGGVRLHCETANRGLLQWIRYPANRIGIGFDLGRNETQVDGVPLGPGRFVVGLPECRVHMHCPSGSVRAVILIDLATLEATAGPMPRTLRPDLRVSSVRDAPRLVAALRTRTAALWQAVVIGGERLVQGDLGHHVVATIKSEFALQEQIGHLPRVDRPGSYRTYGRAIREMAADPAEKLDLPALARKTGRSARSIQAAFARHAGSTPSRCANALRLARARSLLSTDDRAPIGEVAAGCGFFDQSHFSRLYRAQFGEVPSSRRPKNEH